MMHMLKTPHKEESGQDPIEYGLIALIIALGALAGMGTLAQSVNGLYSSIAGSLTLHFACWKQAMQVEEGPKSPRLLHARFQETRLAVRVATSIPLAS